MTLTRISSFTTLFTTTTAPTPPTRSRFERRARTRAPWLLGLLASAALPALAGCGADQDTNGVGQPEPEVTSGALNLSSATLGTKVTDIATLPVYTQYVADLKADGSMRFYDDGTGRLGVQINVTNVGNTAAWGPQGQATINGYSTDAALYQYWGGTASMGNTVNPGERGYILVHVPTYVLAPCATYSVQIDVGHNMQSGLPDPFANDLSNVATQCLRWDSKVNSNNFPVSGPPVEGSTISRIVSSVDIARADGLRCSHCHFQGSGHSYSPPVAQDATTAINPDMVIGGLTWAQSGGWAERFTQRPTDSSAGSKPYVLKMLIQTWLDDGRKGPNPLFARALVTDRIALTRE